MRNWIQRTFLNFLFARWINLNESGNCYQLVFLLIDHLINQQIVLSLLQWGNFATSFILLPHRSAGGPHIAVENKNKHTSHSSEPINIYLIITMFSTLQQVTVTCTTFALYSKHALTPKLWLTHSMGVRFWKSPEITLEKKTVLGLPLLHSKDFFF